jgi:sphingosine-1-phosphate phosphatase 1
MKLNNRFISILIHRFIIMRDFIDYLNDPLIVARFQQWFGVSPILEKKNDKNVKTKKIKENNYEIKSKFWFYLFHLGAEMGNELFYSLFFPIWFWNIDGAIARKVSILWAIFMYIGQATKDILQMPRPATPPVMKLEARYLQEYGFPSTHAMVAAGFPISIVYLSYLRYNVSCLRIYDIQI